MQSKGYKREDKMVYTPLSHDIEEFELPKKFSMLKFNLYDQLSHYRQMITLWRENDALICKVFPSSLGKIGLRWFDKLGLGTIYDWK